MKGHLIVGTGGHGRTVLSYLVRDGTSIEQIEIVDIFEKKKEIVFDCPIVSVGVIGRYYQYHKLRKVESNSDD